MSQQLYFGPETWVGFCAGYGATGLTAWRNADAGLISTTTGTGQVLKWDEIMDLSAFNNMLDWEELPAGGLGYDAKRLVSKIFKPAPFRAKARAMTGIPMYWAAGVCATSTTPATNTLHTITKRTWLDVTNTNPHALWLALHVERGSTAKQIFDLFGVVIDEVTLSCDTEQVVAEWDIQGRAAYVEQQLHASSLAASGSMTSQPYHVNYEPFKWMDCQSSGITFTYNSIPVAATIYGVSWTIRNIDPIMDQPDSNGYMSRASYKMQEHEIRLRVKPRDQTTSTSYINLFDIPKVKPGAYAGALAFTWKLSRGGSSTDYLQMAIDKCYMEPFEEEKKLDDFEEYEIVLRKMGATITTGGTTAASAGTFTGTVLDPLSKDYYEHTT